jgi:serine/threonine protein kinase
MLYFVTDFLNGGELFYHLCNEIRFTEERACFYAAEMVLALSHLHENGIIYRDLKPENVLLDSQGHIKITDFGLSKMKPVDNMDAMTNTFCGTPEYLAPEVIVGKGHSYGVDWWSLGMLLYEMISGINPFKQISQASGGAPNSRHLILKRIVEKDVEILAGFSHHAKSLLSGLLCRDPEQRLKVDQIMAHPFFAKINWSDMLDKNVTPPFVPQVKGKSDISYIDSDFTNEAPQETLQEGHMLQTTNIKNFTYD